MIKTAQNQTCFRTGKKPCQKPGEIHSVTCIAKCQQRSFEISGCLSQPIGWIAIWCLSSRFRLPIWTSLIGGVVGASAALFYIPLGSKCWNRVS